MIKNYTSNDPRTFDRIQKTLISHGARRMMFDYDGNGRVEALAFSIEIDGNEVPFRLPARWRNVEEIFLQKKKKGSSRYNVELTTEQKEQAYRTAWANIRDWLESQMALIETQMVKFEEVFLPYVVQRDGRTYFEHAQEDKYLLPEPKND